VITDAMRVERCGATPLVLVHAPFDFPAHSGPGRRVPFRQIHARTDDPEPRHLVPEGDAFRWSIHEVEGWRSAPTPGRWIATYADWVAERLGLRAGERWLSSAPLGSHAFLLSVLVPLLCGVQVRWMPFDAADPLPMRRALASCRGALLSTEAAARVFGAATIDCADKQLGLYGDPPDEALRDLLAESFGAGRVQSFHGAEETLAFASHSVLDTPIDPDGGLPIGALSPLWRSSEVVRGRRSTQLVLESRPEVGERITVSTGDRVRADGEVLYFVGREDRRIWWRGDRLDLGVVERTLLEIEGVTDAIAAIFTERLDCGEERPVLTGFLERRETIPAALLRRALALRLAPGAIPARLEVVKKFPRPGGEVDLALLLERLG
jgi:hypothetical protein